MRPWRLVQILLLGGAIGLVTLSAFAATNTVPGTNAAKVGAIAITADTLKPSACSGITLTALFTGSGIFSSNIAAELVIGSAGIDTISARNGDDCVVAGAGDDAIDCGGGTDVGLGGPGTDTNTGSRCETFVQ